MEIWNEIGLLRLQIQQRGAASSSQTSSSNRLQAKLDSVRRQRAFTNMSDSKQNFSTAYKSTEGSQFRNQVTTQQTQHAGTSYYLTEILESESKSGNLAREIQLRDLKS